MYPKLDIFSGPCQKLKNCGSVSESFRVLVGSDQWLKERGTYMCIALFCIMAERMKHIIHAQHSFRFLAEHHETLVNGTLAKRLTVEAK